MSCVIFGAGKIARGFIAHLLSLSDIDFIFVEKADALADLINERGQYTINILGAPEKNYVVKNAKALKFSQEKEITEAIAEADVVFDAVGGKNLQEIVPFYIKGIEKKAEKGGYLNFVTCENWKEPARILKEGIEAGIAPEAREWIYRVCHYEIRHRSTEGTFGKRSSDCKCTELLASACGCSQSERLSS